MKEIPSPSVELARAEVPGGRREDHPRSPDGPKSGTPARKGSQGRSLGASARTTEYHGGRRGEGGPLGYDLLSREVWNRQMPVNPHMTLRNGDPNECLFPREER